MDADGGAAWDLATHVRPSVMFPSCAVPTVVPDKIHCPLLHRVRLLGDGYFSQFNRLPMPVSKLYTTSLTIPQ